MDSRRNWLSRTILVALVVLVAQACVPLFTDGDFQTLKLVFKVDQAVAAGAVRPFQTLVFPEAVKVRKTWVQISGRLSAPGNGDLPNSIKVAARVEKLQNGQLQQNLSIKLNIATDGTFSGKKKIKKNLAINDMMRVTLQPSGGAIPKNTEITLCVDLVKKKADLATLPPCVEGGNNGNPPMSQTSLSSIQNSIFTPTCALSGCHSAGSARAGLVLASGQSFSNLVNVPSTGVPSFDRVEPGDPNASYLVKKLRGDGDISGARMPLNGSPLSGSQLDMIVSWIESGAPNN